MADLNDKQRHAVLHNNGSMLVLAGAGSGKTRVLTSRIAWLVTNCGVSINNILAVTFTNKAAKEMQRRVLELLAQTPKADYASIDDINRRPPVRQASLWIGTFHALALRILSIHHVEAGLKAHFQVIDAGEQLAILKKILKEANLDEKKYPPRRLQQFIDKQKEQCHRSQTLVANNPLEAKFIQLYALYEQLCQKNGFVDFSELLLRSYELFTTNAQLLAHYQQQFPYILVDEFQDTNQLQYAWLKLLCGTTGQIFAVGDDDQSIYSFRGAQVANMQSLMRDFAISEPIRLEQNYRSTANILDAANAVISKNRNRIGKNLWTEKKSNEMLKLYAGQTEDAEAHFVVNEIKALISKGVAPSEMAILYRSNAQSRLFEQLLYNAGIAYRIYGGLRFFDRQEIKNALAYLRLVINSDDDGAFLRVVNFPTRGIGEKTIEQVQHIANQHGVSLFKACALLTGKVQANLAKFTQLIDSMQQSCAALSLLDTVQHVIDNSGLRRYYENESLQGGDRLENLDELISAVAKWSDQAGEDAVAKIDFLSQVALGIDTDEHNANKVQLMTIHAAKGLEFKVVFVVGLEEGLFPHASALAEPKELEEERRLMYVAVTRAQELLYLVCASSRTSMEGIPRARRLSRFIYEIPSQLLLDISQQHGMRNKTSTRAIASNARSAAVGGNSDVSNEQVGANATSHGLRIGDKVQHAKFGNGKIVGLRVDGQKNIAEIVFMAIGKKVLDLNIAKVAKI